MSPQQIRSARDVDAQGDIWALGVILYELIVGVTPFDGENLAELVNRIISEPPPSIRKYRPEVTEALEQVIFRCLAKDLSVRFASVAELADALLPFAPRRSVASIERISGVRPAHDTVSRQAPLLAPRVLEPAERASWPQPPHNRTRTRLVLGAVCLVVVALALVVALGGGRERPATAANAANPPSPNVAQRALPPATSPALPSEPSNPLAVTLGAALPAPSAESATVPASPRPPQPTSLPPAAKAEPRRADPFDSNSWGRFRR